MDSGDDRDFPYEPQYERLNDASDFGLDAVFATYVALNLEELERLVPLLKVQHGKDDLMRELVKQTISPAEKASEMIAIALLAHK